MISKFQVSADIWQEGDGSGESGQMPYRLFEEARNAGKETPNGLLYSQAQEANT